MPGASDKMKFGTKFKKTRDKDNEYWIRINRRSRRT